MGGVAPSGSSARHELTAAPRKNLDGDRIHATNRRVQRDGADRIDFGHRGTNHRGAFGRRHVVRLDHETSEAKVAIALRQLEVGDASFHDVGRDVHVNVIGIAHEFSGGRTWNWELSHLAPLRRPPRRDRLFRSPHC
jgi:hypothetical protein